MNQLDNLGSSNMQSKSDERLKNVEDEFTEGTKDSAVSSDAEHSHQVLRGKLNGSEKIWIEKSMDNPLEAKIEILAQEFFRLLIPEQPETRLLCDSHGGYYILSEEISGYKGFQSGSAAKFNDRTYKGLGQVLVGSMYLQEIDLKNGNIGVNTDGIVKKIDGDCCFASITFAPRCYAITPDAISSLPYPKDFHVFNWLDIITGGMKAVGGKIVDHTLTNAPHFRDEVNQAMLKICLLPDSFIELLVATIFNNDNEAKILIELMKSRRNELQISALKNTSFQTYLNTDPSKDDAINIIAQMNSFVINGCIDVVSSDKKTAIAMAALDRLTIITPKDLQYIDQVAAYLLEEFDKKDPESFQDLAAYVISSEKIGAKCYETLCSLQDKLSTSNTFAFCDIVDDNIELNPRDCKTTEYKQKLQTITHKDDSNLIQKP